MNISSYSSINVSEMKQPELIECLSYLNMDVTGTTLDLKCRLCAIMLYRIQCHKIEIESTYGQSPEKINSTFIRMIKRDCTDHWGRNGPGKQFVFSHLQYITFFRKIQDGDIEKYDMMTIYNKRDVYTYHKGQWSNALNSNPDDLNHLRKSILQLEAKQLYLNIKCLTDYLILDIIQHCILCYLRR